MGGATSRRMQVWEPRLKPRLPGLCGSCVPLGQKSTEVKGEFGGWFCPCHGSHYDTSGRIRKGPAPKNLGVPPYVFLDDTNIRIG